MKPLWDNKLIRSLRRRGLAGTVEHTYDNLDSHIRKFAVLDRFLERRFDRKYRVDTAGYDDLLHLKSHPQYPHVNGYDSTPPGILRRMLRGLHLDANRYVFVDLGSGKGKAVLVAAGLPFKRIVGVELSPKLTQIAQKNLASYRGAKKCNQVEFHCMDAAEYEFPLEPVVLFMFNSFKEPVMRAVLENLRRSLQEHPRQVFFLYNIPTLRSLVDRSGFLVPVRHAFWFSIYKTTS